MDVADFGHRVIASVFGTVFFLCVSYLVTVFITTKRRSARLKMIGLDGVLAASTLPIYIAHLVIKKEGALLADGTPSIHFEGSAVPIAEVMAARRIEDALKPGIYKFTPAYIREIIGKLLLDYSNLEVAIEPSPLDHLASTHFPVIISIGGPEFNSVSQKILNSGQMYKILDANNCDVPTITVPSENDGDLHITPDSSNYNLGIVQICTFDRQRAVLLSGVGTNGTLAAVEWFLTHWDFLSKRMTGKSFGICIQCPNKSTDKLGYKKWTLRSEYPPGVLTDLER